MREKFVYIIAIFVLCFGFKAHAQNKIIEYTTQLEILSDLDAIRLDHQINGVDNYMYIDANTAVALNVNAASKVESLYFKSLSEFTLLTTNQSQNLQSVEVINYEWDGKEAFSISDQVLGQLKNLKYVYLRSYEYLTNDVVETAFQDLIKQLKKYPSIVILYYTMEEAS